MWEFKVGAALKKCFTYGKNNTRKRPTRLHVEEIFVASKKTKKLHASGTSLKHASNRYPMSAHKDPAKENYIVLWFSEERVCNSPNLDTR